MRTLLTALALLCALPASGATTTGYDDPILDIPYHVAVGVRGGTAMLLGFSGDAYAMAPAFGAVVDVPFGPEAGVTFELEHAVHELTEPDELIQNASGDLSQGALSGSQRHTGIDVGLKLGLDLTDQSWSTTQRTVAIPWLRLGVGLGITDTSVTLPSFEGQELLRSRNVRTVLVNGIGLQIRIPPRVQIQPNVKSIAFFGIDEVEISTARKLKVEFRLIPSLDLLVSF